MLQSLRALEVDEKHGVVCLVCSILLGIMVLKMSKLICFSELFFSGGSGKFGPQQ